MRVEEFLGAQDDGRGAVGGGTALELGHEFVLDGGGEDLFEGVDVVELGVGVVDAMG